MKRNELIDAAGDYDRVTEFVRLGGWRGILAKCNTPPVIPQHDIRCVSTGGSGGESVGRKLFGLLRAKQQREEESAFLAEWRDVIGDD